MLNIISSNQFKRDLKLAQKRGFDMDKLRTVVNTLANEQPLAEKYKDHSLTCNYSNFRECNIEPYWLLVYRIDKEDIELFLFRTGTHSDLF